MDSCTVTKSLDRQEEYQGRILHVDVLHIKIHKGYHINIVVTQFTHSDCSVISTVGLRVSAVLSVQLALLCADCNNSNETNTHNGYDSVFPLYSLSFSSSKHVAVVE